MRKWSFVLMLLALISAAPSRLVAQQGSVPALPPQAPAPAPTAPVAQPGQYDPRIPAKLQFSAGYTFRTFSPDASTSFKLNGGYISGEYTVFPWLGALVEGTGAVKYLGSGVGNNRQRLTIATALGGGQLYPFRHRKLTLYGHVLVGAGYYNLYAPALGPFASKTIATTGLAYEFGGGVDFRIKRNWAIKLAEGDFLLSEFKASSIGNSSQTGYRISAGIVYLVGQK